MVQKGKKFYVYKVDVRGLSRKQAAKKGTKNISNGEYIVIEKMYIQI